MEVRVIELAGIVPSLLAMRLPKGSESDTEDESTYMVAWNDADTGCIGMEQNLLLRIDPEDLKLAARLIKAGDEHAKAMRGIMVWIDIVAPVYWWREMETYRAGRERLSCESTMHQDCKGLSGKQLQKAKAEIPMGHLQRAIDCISIQTLRRIWLQRRYHRLPEWCEFLEKVADQLPDLVKSLIFID